MIIYTDGYKEYKRKHTKINSSNGLRLARRYSLTELEPTLQNNSQPTVFYTATWFSIWPRENFNPTHLVYLLVPVGSRSVPVGFYRAACNADAV